MTEWQPLEPDDANAFYEARLDAMALMEASLEHRTADLVTVIEPYLTRPYWMFNALAAGTPTSSGSVTAPVRTREANAN